MIFRKMGTLNEFHARKGSPYVSRKEEYISLVLICGFDSTGKQNCKIKCPINPLPIIGWFQPQSLTAVSELIESYGWEKIVSLPYKVVN